MIVSPEGMGVRDAGLTGEDIGLEIGHAGRDCRRPVDVGAAELVSVDVAAIELAALIAEFRIQLQVVEEVLIPFCEDFIRLALEEPAIAEDTDIAIDVGRRHREALR